MLYRRVAAQSGINHYILVFDPGDEAIAELTRFAKETGVTAASFTGIGGCQRLTVSTFSWEEKRYVPIDIEEQVELTSLIGDIAILDGAPSIHAHIVVAKSDGSARGGHLLNAIVRPTLEVAVTEYPVHLHKRLRAGIPIPTIDVVNSTVRD